MSATTADMVSLNYLALKNKHERDANITFEAGPHIYTINDGSINDGSINDGSINNGSINDGSEKKNKYTSVTKWNHSHFAEFDADAIITTMMKGKGWSKSKYFGQTREEIKAGWEKGRDEAAALGTEMHYQIECYYNGGGVPREVDSVTRADGGVPRGVELGGEAPLSPTASGIAYFLNFVEACPNLKPYRTEWMIYHEDLLLAGSIDMVYENNDGSLMIYDWKRTKDITKSSAFMKYALTECISHLPDTNFWHYALQLNTYKAILEQKYGKTVTKLALVCLHPSKANFEVIPVPVLTTEMEALFALRREQVLSRTQ